MKIKFKVDENYRINIINITEIIIVLIFALNCRTVYTEISNTYHAFNAILAIAIVFSAPMYIMAIKKYHRRSLNSLVRLLLASFGVSILYIAGNGNNLWAFFKLEIVTIAIYFICITAKEGKRIFVILFRYENLMVFISIISLLFWTLGSILHVISPTGHVMINWAGNEDNSVWSNTYYNIHFETQGMVINGHSIIRNTGIFVESTVYGFNLTLAFLIELFFRKKKSKFRIIILIITIFTSLSTTAIIIAFSSVVIKTVTYQAYSIRFKAICTMILIPIMLVCIYAMMSAKLSTVSGVTRVDDISAGIKAWSDNILFGCGVENNAYIKYRTRYLDNLGFSNSLIQILVYGGLLLISPYVFSVYKWYKYAYKNHSKEIAIFITMFILSCIPNIIEFQYITLFIFLLGYNLCIWNKKYSKIRARGN